MRSLIILGTFLGSLTAYLVTSTAPLFAFYGWLSPGIELGPNNAFLWQYKVGTEPEAVPPLLKKQKELPNVVTTEDALYFIQPSGKVNKVKKTEGFYYSQAAMGNAYLQYQKYDPNMKIKFFTATNRQFWDKDDHSYPIMNASGQLNLFLSSNNYRVAFVDKNGVYLNTVEGPFIIDYVSQSWYGLDEFRNEEEPAKETALEYAAVAFLGGFAYVSDAKGKILLSLNESDFNYKSVALSANARFLMIHGMSRSEKGAATGDFVAMFDVKTGKEIYREELGTRYPYKLYMAVANDGRAAVNFPQLGALLDSSGKVDYVYFGTSYPDSLREKPVVFDEFYFLEVSDDLSDLGLKAEVRPPQGIFHPAISNGRDFVIGRGEQAVAVNSEGEWLRKIARRDYAKPWRFQFNRSGNILVVEDGYTLRYYRLSRSRPL